MHHAVVNQTTINMVKITTKLQIHLADLIKWDTDGENGDNKYTRGIIVVMVNNPQGDAEHLEHIEWVEDLKSR